jgi:hypothetical protein
MARVGSGRRGVGAHMQLMDGGHVMLRDCCEMLCMIPSLLNAVCYAMCRLKQSRAPLYYCTLTDIVCTSPCFAPLAAPLQAIRRVHRQCGHPH